MINVPTKVLLSMRKIIVAACVVVFGLMSSNAFSNEAAISIAVVDVAYLMKNSPEAELASQALKAEFSPREEALKQDQENISKLEAELERNKSAWSTEQVRQANRQIRSLERERGRALEDFREELRFARDGALDDVQKNVFLAIEEVRVEQNIDIVFQEYVAASERVNLTNSVIAYLKKKIEKKQSETTDTNKIKVN